MMSENRITEKLSENSIEGISVLKIMNQSCSKFGDHYVLPLLFRNNLVNLPNNKRMAKRRLQRLKKKLQKR